MTDHPDPAAAEEPAVEGEVVDEGSNGNGNGDGDTGRPGAEIARQAPAGAQLAVTPQVTANELVGRLEVIKEAQERAMQRDVDYGVIPGTKKPSLYKPGAEKLGVLFQLDIQPDNQKQWGPGDHLTVISHAPVYYIPTGTRLGYGEGVCTTRERRYAYRRQDRICPDCGEAAVLESNHDDEWFCWRKKGGCGHKWAADSEQGRAFEAMEIGEIENPDLPDLWNTVVKMAEKRARVDAVLAVTGASALFTQDVEDTGAVAAEEADAGSNRGPAFGEAQSDEQRQALSVALTWLLGPEAKGTWEKLKESCDGYMPAVVAEAILEVARTKKTLDEG